VVAPLGDALAGGTFEIEGEGPVVESGPPGQHVARERPEPLAHAVEPGPGVSELHAQPLVHVLVKVFEEFAAGLVQAGADLFVHLGLEPAERRVDLGGGATLLVDGKDALLEVDPRLDAAQDFVGGSKDTAEEAELLDQELEDPAISLVPLVQEVDDHDVVLLTIAMAAPDALLDALGIPGQIIVHDQRAELQVDALGRGLGSQQDGALVAEVLDERGAHIHGPRARGAPGLAVQLGPGGVDGRRFRPRVRAVEQDDLALVALRLEEGLEIVLGAAGLGEDQGLARRARLGHLRKADLQGLKQRPRLGVDPDAARPGGESTEDVDLLEELLPVDDSRCLVCLLGALVRGQDLVEQVALDLLRLDERLGEVLVVHQVPLVQHRLQPGAQGLEGRGDGPRRRGEQLAKDQGRQVPLAPGQGIALLALEEARDRLVQRLFVIGGVERLGDGMPFGVPDILRDLVSQSALAEAGQPPAQGFETARGGGVLGAKGVDVAEEALVDQGREPVELEQRVLQGRRRQQQLAAVLRGPSNALAHLVAGTVGVAKLVGLVDDHQVPGLRLQLFAHAVGEVEGQDDDARTLQGIPAGPAGFPPAQRVENHRRQVELLL